MKCQIPGCDDDASAVIIDKKDGRKLITCGKQHQFDEHKVKTFNLCSIKDCEEPATHVCDHNNINVNLCENHYDLWLNDPYELGEIDANEKE